MKERLVLVGLKGMCDYFDVSKVGAVGAQRNWVESPIHLRQLQWDLAVPPKPAACLAKNGNRLVKKPMPPHLLRMKDGYSKPRLGTKGLLFSGFGKAAIPPFKHLLWERAQYLVPDPWFFKR